MSDESELVEHLKALSVPITGSVVRDVLNAERFFVFVEVERNSKNLQSPSNKELGESRKTLNDLGYSIEYILVDGRSRDLESGLRATLLHTFGNDLRNVFLSTRANRATVWLDQKRKIDDETLSSLQRKSAVFLEQVGLVLESVMNQADQNLPSKLVCLKLLRLSAPQDPENFANIVRRHNFIVPSTDWMGRRLDSIRKSGEIVRRSDGKYALTLSCLRTLGTKRNRSSPDVERLLALARGKY